MTYKPLQADSPESQDHACTLQSCHGAVVAPLSEMPQEGSSVFSNKAPFGLPLLASSYSRVTASSVFCAQNIFSGPSVWAPLTNKNIVVHAASIFRRTTVFGLFWIMLKTSDLPVALFVFFKYLTQTFWFYHYIVYTCSPFLLRLRT